jgi:hypothetical protein
VNFTWPEGSVNGVATSTTRYLVWLQLDLGLDRIREFPISNASLERSWFTADELTRFLNLPDNQSSVYRVETVQEGSSV